MFVNCGFFRRKGKETEYRNVANIRVDGLTREDGVELRRELMKHAPTGEGWSISGYYFASEDLNDETS